MAEYSQDMLLLFFMTAACVVGIATAFALRKTKNNRVSKNETPEILFKQKGEGEMKRFVCVGCGYETSAGPKVISILERGHRRIGCWKLN